MSSIILGDFFWYLSVLCSVQLSFLDHSWWFLPISWKLVPQFCWVPCWKLTRTTNDPQIKWWETRMFMVNIKSVWRSAWDFEQVNLTILFWFFGATILTTKFCYSWVPISIRFNSFFVDEPTLFVGPIHISIEAPHSNGVYSMPQISTKNWRL